ncbi:caveolin-2 [Lampris incognitus]|uniref:caveolin-2 n=1 Tax=Lampris incognitus TaxID=2546036 RepID=UPI0024B60E8A|nr:caveolin-2 [Lampris incognitus]
MAMMVSDDCLVECKIDDDEEEEEDDSGGAGEDGEEQINTPPPPPEFASETPTPPFPSVLATPPATPTQPPPANRDPYGINRHLQVEVSDVLAEPATPHSMDTVWAHSVVGFELTRVWTYQCLSLLCAVPFALISGILVATLACLHIWCVIPFIQLSNTFLPCLRSLWICAVNTFIAPFISSLAYCCAYIVISLSHKDWPANKQNV